MNIVHVGLALLGSVSLVHGAVTSTELAAQPWADASTYDSYYWNPTVNFGKTHTTTSCAPYNGDCSGDFVQVPIAHNCPATPWTKEQLETYGVTTGEAQFMNESPPADWTSDFAYHFDAGFIKEGFGQWTALGHGFYCPTADPLFWFNSETDSFIWANEGKWTMGKPSVQWWWELDADTTYSGPWSDQEEATAVPTPTPPQLSHSGTWGDEAFFDVTVSTSGPVEMTFSSSSKAVGVSHCSLTVDGTQIITLFRTGIVSQGAAFQNPNSITLTGAVNGAANVVTTIAVTAQRFGKCTTFGDPHVKTFDGQTSDPFGAGDHTLVSTPSGDFVVQARQGKCGHVACNFGAAVKWRDTIFVSSSKGEFSNNVDEGVLIEKRGAHLFRFSTIDGVEVVILAGYYYQIFITLPPHYRNNVDGICGNFNGNKADEPFGWQLFSDYAIDAGQSLFHLIAPGGSGADVIPASSFAATDALQCTGHPGWNRYTPSNPLSVDPVSPPPTGGGLECKSEQSHISDKWCNSNCRWPVATGGFVFNGHVACANGFKAIWPKTCTCGQGGPPPTPDATPLNPTSPAGKSVIAVCAEVLKDNNAAAKCEAVGVDVQKYYATCLLDGKVSGATTDGARRSLALMSAQAMAADCVAEGGKAGQDLTEDVYEPLVLQRVVEQTTTAASFEEYVQQLEAVPLQDTPITAPKECTGALFSIGDTIWRKVRSDYTMVQEYSDGWVIREALPANAGESLAHGDHGDGWSSDEQGVTLVQGLQQTSWTWCCACA